MSSEQQQQQQPVDPQAVEETKQQIRGLVEEITRLTKQELAPEVFYGEFLQRVVSALAAIGGAVWIVSEDGPLRLVYQINLRQSMPEEQGEDHARHARLLHRVVRTGEELLVPPYSGAEGDSEAGNPTAYLLVLAPLRSDQRNVGVVEVFQRPRSGPASQRGYLRFLSQMCALAGEYLRGRRLRQLTDWQSLFSKADQFARLVHNSLEPRTTAYTIANEGRRLIGCDRVSVAVRKGNRCVIQAVSGQDTMDTRANTVVLLGKLATAVVRNGEPLWYTGPTDDLAPQIETALHEYVDECHSKSVAVLPLYKPKEPEDESESPKSKRRADPEAVGALVIEQIEDNRPREAFSQSVQLVAEHSARAMANAMEHNNLFLMPVWRTLGKARWVVQGRTLPKTLVIAAVALVAIVSMFVIPYDFKLEGKGTLVPRERRDVFVNVEGTSTVQEVKVKQGDSVEKGQLLVELDNSELKLRIEQLIEQRQKVAEGLMAAQRERQDARRKPEEKMQAAAQISIYRQQLTSLNDQLKLLEGQSERLMVKSPIDGQIVTTWNKLEQLEQRPVTAGQVLMMVADPKSTWELEIYMPEDTMGHVARAWQGLPKPKEMKVTYVLANEPQHQHEGTVIKIGESAELHEEYGHCVPVRVKINDKDVADRRVGIEATAKLHCGRRPIGYVWFHELIEFVQSRVLF
jgi:hypothetical protein